MIVYPKELDIIFKKLIHLGIRPVLVGGFVRDFMLQRESKDIDIELYGNLDFGILCSILEEFGSVNSVGKSFGVCKLRFGAYDLDFSFPRRDNKTGVGHRGFEVSVETNMEFKTAASRRDFTINAMGYDIAEKIFLDPFGGAEDLKNGVLRAVNLKSFAQDPLRILRAAQFCARFNLTIEPSLLNICKEMVLQKMLQELPKERIFEEIKKLLLKAQKPSLGFELLEKFGTHLYTKNATVSDEIAKRLTTNKQTNLVLMLAGLCYTMEQKETEDFLLRFTNEKEIIKRVLWLVLAYNEMVVVDAKERDDYFLYKLALKVSLEELVILSLSIAMANNDSKTFLMAQSIEKRAKELSVFQKKLPPFLHGKDLIACGLQPSLHFKTILEKAYEEQMHGKFQNYSQAMCWLREYLQL